MGKPKSLLSKVLRREEVFVKAKRACKLQYKSNKTLKKAEISELKCKGIEYIETKSRQLKFKQQQAGCMAG